MFANTHIFSTVLQRRNHPSLAHQPIGVLRSVDERAPYLKSHGLVATEVGGVGKDDAFVEDHVVHGQRRSGSVHSRHRGFDVISNHRHAIYSLNARRHSYYRRFCDFNLRYHDHKCGLEFTKNLLEGRTKCVTCKVNINRIYT